MERFAKISLPLTAAIAVVSMVSLEWEITASAAGYKAAIAAIGLVRFVLLVSSAGLRAKSPRRANVVIGFSLIITIALAGYAEMVEGLSANERLVYHVANLSITFCELAAAFAFAPESSLDETLAQAQRDAELVVELTASLDGCRRKLASATQTSPGCKAAIEAYFNKPFLDGNTYRYIHVPTTGEPLFYTFPRGLDYIVLPDGQEVWKPGKTPTLSQ